MNRDKFDNELRRIYSSLSSYGTKLQSVAAKSYWYNQYLWTCSQILYYFYDTDTITW